MVNYYWHLVPTSGAISSNAPLFLQGRLHKLMLAVHLYSLLIHAERSLQGVRVIFFFFPFIWHFTVHTGIYYRVAHLPLAEEKSNLIIKDMSSYAYITDLRYIIMKLTPQITPIILTTFVYANAPPTPPFLGLGFR